MKTEEISIKQILLAIKDYILELKRSWKFLPLFIIPVLVWYGYDHYSYVPTYKTKVKFIVENGGGSGSLGGLLGQFGLGGGEGGIGPLKIKEVINSREIIGNAILKKGKDTPALANKIIESYQFDEKWSENSEKFKDFKFHNTFIDSLNNLEAQAFLKIYKKIVGPTNDNSHLFKFDSNMDSQIMTLKCETNSDEISKELIISIFTSCKDFFENKMFREKILTRDFIQVKKDSIQGLLDNKVLSLARFDNRNRNMISQEEMLPRDKLKREIAILSASLIELTKNYEFIDYNIKSSKPFFFALDKPIGLIPRSGSNLIIKLMTGFFVGSFFFVLFIAGRKFFQDVLTE